jgi:hypothetical protein
VFSSNRLQAAHGQAQVHEAMVERLAGTQRKLDPVRETVAIRLDDMLGFDSSVECGRY